MARILVVDDEKDIRKLVSHTLGFHGHDIVEAASGGEAIERIKAQSPDLIVLDIMMPDMNGWDVLRELRKRGLKGKSRVLVLTAKTQEVDFATGWRLGVDDYVTKPFDPDELALAVSETLMLSPEQIRQKRTDELEKANLLSWVESVFDEPEE